MSKELELWQFISAYLRRYETVTLLVVAESSGSSPGRAGYKMAVAADGELCGSIGGGVMEVTLVELAKGKSKKAKGKNRSAISEQVHRKNAPNASGMICSGRQTVIFTKLDNHDWGVVKKIIKAFRSREPHYLSISPVGLAVTQPVTGWHYADRNFEIRDDSEFIYSEKIGPKNDLYIVGGGHCALALSELMSRMDFHISIFDDRPYLNTIEKNLFADDITIIESYEQIGELIPAGSNIYVVVMTLGYKSDETVIRGLLDKDLKYFGVLGSQAKMKTLLNALAKEGVSKEKLQRIHTPIGLAINSRTPEEIAVSIAAEIIAVKNS